MRSGEFNDVDLQAVVAAILTLDSDGSRIAQVLRGTLDQLYDGQRTGRYRWDQLRRTETKHVGKIVEMNLHREFKFEDSELLDYKIAGIEVDCKYSQSLNGWMIPPEAHGHLCLVVWADDQKSEWSMGVVRTNSDCLNTGGNRDKKATLNEVGRNAIHWLFENNPLPPNILLQLDKSVVDRIMSQGSGQKNINELFRNTLCMRVGRAVVATVGQQDDYMKRVRNNGGARTTLKPEGIVILGQYEAHRSVARALGVPQPGKGESVSVRIVPASGVAAKGAAKIGRRWWRVAKPGDKVVRAPDLPKAQ